MTEVIEQIKVKEIKQGKEKRNVPRLRFRRFEDNWVNYKFGNITKKTGIKNKEDKPYAVYSISNKYGFVPQNEQFEGSRLENLDKKSYKIVNNNEFSYNPARINVGSIGLLEEKKSVIVSSLYVCFKMNEYMNSVFFKVYFNTNIFNKNVLRNVEGGVRDYLFYENFSNIKVNVPSLQEQKKIADFFSLVDKKIEKQSEKVEALKTYKKGIMQKIFKQEIRFKDENGREYPEWEKKRLGEILRERKLYCKKGLDYPHVTLSKDGIYDKSERYDRDFLVKNDNKDYKVTLKNDICYNPANLKFGVICRNKYGSAIFSPIYVTFEIINCNSIFIEHLVTRNNFINKVRKYEEGTVYERMSVKPENLLKFNIKIPDLREQTKIAEFLTTIDEKMDKEEKKLEELKVWKKGLLQKMFV